MNFRSMPAVLSSMVLASLQHDINPTAIEQIHGTHMRMHSGNASMVCGAVGSDTTTAVPDGEINMIDADGDTEVAAVEKG
jgi:hypothetical protein